MMKKVIISLLLLVAFYGSNGQIKLFGNGGYNIQTNKFYLNSSTDSLARFAKWGAKLFTSLRIYKDSVPISATTDGMYVLVIDTTATVDSNKVKRVAASAFVSSNIYTADGSISGTRAITASGSANVVWNGFNNFQINNTGPIQVSSAQYVDIVGGLRLTSIVESNAGTLTLDNQTVHYIFTGTTTTWTLPDRASNPRQVFFIKNAGSGDVTLNAAGADTIYDTSSVTSITIGPGAARMVLSGITTWYVQ